MEIKIELSDPNNKNGNACVDKAIGEIIDEITRLLPSEQPLTQTLLAQAVLQLNGRIRRRGKLSASEILFSRDQLNNHNLSLEDKILQSDQTNTRHYANQRNNQKVKLVDDDINQGDIIQMKNNPKKHQVREPFLVVEVCERDKTINAKKMLHTKTEKKTMIQRKQYKFPIQRVEKLNKSTFSTVAYNKIKQNKHNLSLYQWTPFRTNYSSDSFSSDLEELDNEHLENNENLITDEQLIHGGEEVNHPELAEHVSVMDIDNQHDSEENIIENMEIDQTLNNTENVQNQAESQDEITENENMEIADQNNEEWADVNDGDDEIDQDSNLTGTKRKIRKEIWSTKDSYRLRYTPYRKSKAKQSSEILREDDNEVEKQAILSTETTRTRVLSSDEDSIREPSIEWDTFEPSPTYFGENDLAMVDEYPKSIDPGRVYDFSNLPPLELYPERVEYGRVYDFSHLPPYPIVTNNDTDTEIQEIRVGKPSKKPKLIKKIKKAFLH